jgi:HK97 gp10 family phage protein
MLSCEGYKMADDAGRLGNMMRQHLVAAMNAGKAAARTGGEEIANVMRVTAPRDEHALIRSIRVEDTTTRKTSKGETGFVGVVVKAGDETTIVTNSRGQRFQNAKLQEHGTKKMPANPYFNASYRRMRSRVKSRITRAVRQAWLKG